MSVNSFNDYLPSFFLAGAGESAFGAVAGFSAARDACATGVGSAGDATGAGAFTVGAGAFSTRTGACSTAAATGAGGA